MSVGMDIQLNGERIDGGDEDEEHPYLNVYRNQKNPRGFIITVEEGEETHSVRITTDSMKILMKHVIDTLR